MLSCSSKGMALRVGNRTQPTNTFNRTCVQFSSAVALFDPVPPAGALPSCVKSNATHVKPLGK